jgi:hypothetical protein
MKVQKCLLTAAGVRFTVTGCIDFILERARVITFRSGRQIPWNDRGASGPGAAIHAQGPAGSDPASAPGVIMLSHNGRAQ